MPENLQAELAALKAAYRQGVRRLTYDGKTVEYDDEASLRRRIAFVEAELRATSATPRPVAGFAGFRRS